MTINVVQTEQTEKNKLTAIIEMITVTLLNISFWYCFFTASAIAIHWSIYIVSFLAPVLMYALCCSKTFGKYSFFYFILIIALVTIITYSYSSKAFAILFNEIVAPINKNGIVIVPFSSSIPLDKIGNYIYFAVSILVLTSAMLISNGIKNMHAFLTTLILVLPLILGIIFNLLPSLISILVFLAILIIYIYVCVTKKKESRGNTNIVSLQVVSCAIFLIIAILLSVFSINTLKPVEKLRTNITYSINNYRYSPKSDLTVQKLPEGDLTKAGTLTFTGNPVFTVEVDNPSQLYFRSFVGENFSNGKWSALSNPYTGRYFGMMEYLDAKNFHPYFQLSNSYKAEASRTGTTTKLGKITVKNQLENSKRLYTTYETVFDNNINDNKTTENMIISNGLHGQREYSINAYTPIYNDYAKDDLDSWVRSINKKTDLTEYNQLESIYRSFVYNNYLNVDSKYLKAVEELNIGKIKNEKYSDLVLELRQKFQESFSYSEVLDLGNESDPFFSFATETKKGYDCYFATLAVLALRNNGIPARYAEGYYIPASDMEMYKTLDDIEFDVCDTAEHSWVEIYVDSVGWVPVEVTPGYYSLDKEDSNSISTEEESTPHDDEEYYYDENESNNVEETAESNPQNNTLLIVIISLAAVVLLTILILLLKRSITMKHIKRAETYKDTITGYRLIAKRVKHSKCNTESQDYKDYMQLVYKERYSREGLSGAERKQASEFVLKLVKYKY